MRIPVKKKLYHKYGAIRCERDEIKFPSKLERSCYDYLKLMKEQGKILFFLMQIPFLLPAGYKHLVDFMVFYPNTVEFIECKGRDLAVGQLKRQQVEELYGITVHLVKRAEEIQFITKC